MLDPVQLPGPRKLANRAPRQQARPTSAVLQLYGGKDTPAMALSGVQRPRPPPIDQP